MAVPTISAISPTAGHTGGRSLVAIDGTGFRLPVPPPAVNGITPEAPASVRVSFGSGATWTAATSVSVFSSTLLHVLTPIHDPTDDPIDVRVENLADDGTPIPGEVATLPAAWRFVRPNLTDGDSDLVRLVRAFVAELRRQITPNVVWPEHTDFDGDTGDTLSTTEVPSFPGLIVAATTLEDNDFYSDRSRIEVVNPDDPDGFVTYEPPVTVDVVFSVVGVSDSNKEMLNLAATVRRFFRKNPYLTMARDPDDASKGEVRYEMNAEDAPNVSLRVDGNEDNLRTFAISARVLGFDIESMHEIRESDGEPARGPGQAAEGGVETGRTLENDVQITI